MSETAPMTGRQPPALSVVVVTPAGFDLIRRTVEAVRAQSIRGDIELLIVAPASPPLSPAPEAVAGFWGVQVVPGCSPWREARAAGVRQANAPVVAFAEEHSFAEPGWAQALVEAHRGPWDTVGPAMLNCNPGTAVSWAAMLLDFGASLAPVEAGPAHQLPGHNTSYKRAVLLDYGARLDNLLANEVLLIADLHKRGCRLYLEPAAQVRHMNCSRLASLLTSKYYGGRIFGSARARHENWRPLRRLAYALGGPLIGLARLRYAARAARRTGQGWPMLAWILPAAAVGLLAHGLGEAVGGAFGPGDTEPIWMSIEFDRRRHVVAAEAGSEA